MIEKELKKVREKQVPNVTKLAIIKKIVLT